MDEPTAAPPEMARPSMKLWMERATTIDTVSALKFTSVCVAEQAGQT